MTRSSHPDLSVIAPAREVLSTAWAEGDWYVTAARAVATLVPGAVGLVYDWSDDEQVGRLVGTREIDLGPVRAELPRVRGYDPSRRGPYSNRVVDSETLVRGERKVRERLRSHLRAVGVRDQLRTVLYDGDDFLAWVGLVMPEGGAPFDRDAAKALGQLVPDLLDGLVVAKALGAGPQAAAGLAEILDGLPTPAWLFTGRGRIAFANRTARGSYDAVPEWVGARDPRARGRAIEASLEVDGRTLRLVLDRRPPKKDPLAAAGLPPRHLRVARLLAEGLADKEIAVATDLSLATVRTYARSIFRALGVHSRTELMRKVLG